MHIKRLCFGTMLFWYGAVSVFFTVGSPKILIGKMPLYFSDFLLAFAVPLMVIVARTRYIRINFPLSIILAFLFYIFIFLGCTVSAYLFAEIEVTGLLLLIKRILYHPVLWLLIYCGCINLGDRMDRTAQRFTAILICVAIPPMLVSFIELYVFAELGLATPMKMLASLSDSYSPTLFAVGFTGRAVGPEGIYLVGSSSINYGILNGIISLSALCLYEKSFQIRWLIAAVLFATGVLVSNSSTAMIFLLSVITMWYVVGRKFVLKSVCVLLVAIVCSLLFATLPIDTKNLYAAGDLIQTFQDLLSGGGERSRNVDLRLLTYQKAILGMENYPHVLLVGSGIGPYAAMIMNDADPLIESFILEAFLISGIFGFLCLMFSFILIATRLRVLFVCAYDKGIAAKIVVCVFPGLIFANVFSGNSLQSEFVGSVFFTFLGIAMARAQMIATHMKQLEA
jgi:hypothetical protein